ncbi:MAG: GNAT family N-acetyltransferase [Eubacteriales bacterium]|nr:GNAT family N-acetyltransferase [Eubacteriales bacterium]
MEILQYSQADWPALQEIHDLARMQELSLAGLKAAFVPLDLAAEREGLFDYRVYVAKEDQPVGFVAFTEDELAWLYVHPDHQHRGVGRALAQFALEHMAEGDQTVEVLAGNEPARSLYRSLGFTEEQLLHGHMPGNEEFEVSAWQMTRRQD